MRSPSVNSKAPGFRTGIRAYGFLIGNECDGSRCGLVGDEGFEPLQAVSRLFVIMRYHIAYQLDSAISSIGRKCAIPNG